MKRLSRLGCLFMLVAAGELAAYTNSAGAEALAPSAVAAASDGAGEATPVPAGTFVLVEGTVQLGHGETAPRPAHQGDAVNEGDRIRTGHDGEAHLGMQDGGFLVLRADTDFTVEQYRADAGDDDRAIFRLLSGAVRSVSGWIGRFNRSQDLIHTPVATIGIRGTDHEVRLVGEGSADGEPGVYDRVYAGETEIRTDAGSAAVTSSQAGFAGSRQRGRPRLLAGIPVFFRPGPHEAEIARKHEEIQRHIEERRAARRQAVMSARQALREKRSATRADAQRQHSAAQEERKAAAQTGREFAARRTELKAQADALRQRRGELEQRRAALAADVQAGRLSAAEARERERTLREEAADLNASRRSLEQSRKSLERDAAGAVDARFDAQAARLKARHDAQVELREQRDAVAHQTSEARNQSRQEQREENHRLRDDLRRDAAQGAGAAPATP